MGDQNKLNDVANTYNKMRDPDWRVGKKKDVDAFSKGFNSPGTLKAAEPEGPGMLSTLGDKLKRAWGEIKK